MQLSSCSVRSESSSGNLRQRATIRAAAVGKIRAPDFSLVRQETLRASFCGAARAVSARSRTRRAHRREMDRFARSRRRSEPELPHRSSHRVRSRRLRVATAALSRTRTRAHRPRTDLERHGSSASERAARAAGRRLHGKVPCERTAHAALDRSGSGGELRTFPVSCAHWARCRARRRDPCTAADASREGGRTRCVIVSSRRMRHV
jgi:hypothetical protein